MAGNPQVLGLLEEMLDSGKTPEEVCRDCPELLPEVRRRWQEFQFVDAQVRTLLPGIATRPAPGTTGPPATGLPQVPGYEVEAMLGRGGMGVVYRARHLALKRTVAIKMLAAGHSHPIDRARFRAEAEAVARLQHPNIVQIHEVGEADGRPFFALEYVAGGSLAERLAGRPLPPPRAARLVAALAEAMHLAHSRNLVHRDLKPANILLAEGGGQESGVRSHESGIRPALLTPDSYLLTPKITDFGLVRQLDADSGQTFDGVVMGTPCYMAPEQAEGRARSAGPAADVYALGAILYECLTGRPPFEGATPLETLAQVRSREPAAPSSLNRQVPRDLETICLKCLRKEPERRYSSARELADDLGRFVRGEPVAARPVGAVERARKWVGRRPAAAGLLAAVVLLVAVGGAGTWLLYRQRATDRNRQAQTDQDVRRVLEQAQALLEKGWRAADLAILTEAGAEGHRAQGMALSGGASAPVQQEAEAFRDDAGGRLERAETNRALLKALLDVSAPLETVARAHDQGVRMTAPGQPSVDEQYAAAFRRWGLDVDAAPEDEVVARLGAEPDVVVQEIIAGLDGWMMERRRQMRPDAEWRRLFRVADQLDRNGRHRRLRALLAGGSPPRPETVTGLLAAEPPWAALWELARGTDWRQLQAMRREIDSASEPVMTVVLLAQACAAVGDAAGAEQVLRQAATVRPDQAVLLTALGNLLEQQGPSWRGKAIEYYRAARAQRPRLGIALSGALIRAGRADEAEEVVQDLIRQQPDSAMLYNSLGTSLITQRKFAAAEAAYRKATELQPDLAEAHYNLGLALASQGHHGAAEAAYRKAIDLRPDFMEAYNNLGLALTQQQEHGAAEAAYRKTTDLRPDFAGGYNNLGMALATQRKRVEAEAAFRKALDVQPDFALAHLNRAAALMELARFDEALPLVKKGTDLLPARDPTREGARLLLQGCQRLMALNARLPLILRGAEKPANAAEQIELAQVCGFKKLHAAAARFYRDAFAAEPKLAEPVPVSNRYDAACAAAQAGCAHGQAADTLDEQERAHWRRQARQWLRQDLTWWGAALDNGSAQTRADVRWRMQIWQIDRDLAGLREPEALEALSPDERRECLALWQEVAALLGRVRTLK
jgi:serine/threonine-protein kinase